MDEKVDEKVCLAGHSGYASQTVYINGLSGLRKADVSIRILYPFTAKNKAQWECRRRVARSATAGRKTILISAKWLIMKPFEF